MDGLQHLAIFEAQSLQRQVYQRTEIGQAEAATQIELLQVCEVCKHITMRNILVAKAQGADAPRQAD
jgi:hypothetical protein